MRIEAPGWWVVVEQPYSEALSSVFGTLRRTGGFLLLGLTGIFLHNVLVLVAVEYVQANRANVIFASIPLMVALIDIALLRRLPPLLAMLGLVAGIAGTTLVVTDGRPLQLLDGALGRGEWLVLASAASWAAYSVLGRPLLERHSPLVVTYHPAYLLRNLPDKARAWDDLCLAAQVAESAPEARPADPTRG